MPGMTAGISSAVDVTHPRCTRYSNALDAWRRYLTNAPTASGIAATLQSVDQGDIAAMCELQQEMEAKDAHLLGMASRRRESLTALEWSIIPDRSTDDEDAALESAEYCQRVLAGISTWDDTLIHLSHATGPGVAATELLWSEGQLVDTVDVPGHRLMSNPSKSTRIHVETQDHPVEGVPMYSPGFIVHIPNKLAGFPMRVTLTRATAFLWILKHFACSDWAAFSEVYGQPIRMGTYEQEPTQEDRDTAIHMLKNMGSDCWGVFPAGIKLELLEAARSNQPYEAIINWIEAKQSILWLGQTLTTEPGAVGSLALGRVHENVRASITLSDIQAEARTIREQVLRPMTRLRWPQQNKPVPHFKRAVAEDANVELRRLRLDELRFAREANLSIDPNWMYEELNIPQPTQTDESETEV